MSLTRFQVESVLQLELFATIIDCLEEYPEALKSCSLVSHSWLLFARPHVFRKLQLDSYYHGWGPSGCKLLWGLVEGSSPYCPYIQTLGIEDSEDLGMKIEAIMVAGLIKNLPRLRSLYLDRLVSSTMTLVTRPLLSIHHLSLELPTLSPKSLIDTLMIFSEIYHLHVSIDDSPTQGYEHEHSTVMDSLQIRTLSLEACRYGIAIIRKVLQPILVHITSLNIPHYAITDVEFIGELIHDLSSQLDSLTLAVIYRPANKDLDDLALTTRTLWSTLHLSRCRVLRCITLNFSSDLIETYSRKVDINSMVFGILEQVPPSIQSLTFRMGYYDLQHNCRYPPSDFTLDWKRLGTIVNKMRNLT